MRKRETTRDPRSGPGDTEQDNSCLPGSRTPCRFLFGLYPTGQAPHSGETVAHVRVSQDPVPFAQIGRNRMKGAVSTHFCNARSTPSGGEFQLSMSARRRILARMVSSGSGSPTTATSAMAPRFR